MNETYSCRPRQPPLPVVPSGGGDLVRLVGADLANRVRVLFGAVLAEVLSVRDEAGQRIVDLRTPVHAVGVVDV